jgi:bacillopeptidase F (M6 metalloprotease family)
VAEDRAVGPFNSNVTEDFELDVDAAACVAPGYGLSYLYFENFQASNGGYTLSGTAPAPWQWGQPTTWPAACAEGTNCWGTNLTGLYNPSANETLTSPVIDLSSVAPGTTLTARWYQANHIETFTWDKAYAEVSIDGGPWTIMWQNPGATVAEGWRELTYDVSAAAGTNVQLRWRFTSDSSVQHPGLYIDRVAIADDAGCAPAAGGLAVGNVYDENTGTPSDRGAGSQFQA